MVKKVSVDVFLFDELPKKTQEKVIEKNRDINVDFNWWESELDYFVEEAKKIGFDINPKEIEFDLYHNEFKIPTNKISMPEYNMKIGGNYFSIWNRDINENYIEYADTDDPKELKIIVIRIIKLQDLMKKMLKSLNDIYMDLMSDEQVAETLRINEYTFLSDGKMVNW